MALKPTMREKDRWLALEVASEGEVSEREVSEAVERAALAFLGQLGVARAGVRFVEFDAKRGICVLQCNAAEVLSVRAALFLLDEIGKKRAALRTLAVSGTLRKLRAKLASGG
ncbi:MAG: Rpp14/Pop5 family protein [Candidatus Micrarchaeia archaeon]